MRLRALAAAGLLVVAPPTLADAADPPRGSDAAGLERAIGRRLPKGWRMRRTGLPDGVAAVVEGPRTAAGRAVIALRPFADGAAPDPEALAAELSRTRGATVSVARGPLGWELTPETAKGRPRVVWIVADEGVLTLAAPSRQFIAAYRRVVKAGLAARR